MTSSGDGDRQPDDHGDHSYGMGDQPRPAQGTSADLTTDDVPQRRTRRCAADAIHLAGGPVDIPAAMIQTFKSVAAGEHRHGPGDGSGDTAPPRPRRSRCTRGCCAGRRRSGRGSDEPNPTTSTLNPSYIDQAAAANYATTAAGAMPLRDGPPATYPMPGSYYWVCLRRPANLFAPVSITNPMVVVDSMRFPYIGRHRWHQRDHRTPGDRCPHCLEHRSPTTGYYSGVLGSAVSALSRRPCRAGGAAGDGDWSVPPATATHPGRPALWLHRADVVPSVDSQIDGAPRASYYYDSGGNNVYTATQKIYHTLGWANEYEQGSGNSAGRALGLLPVQRP